LLFRRVALRITRSPTKYRKEFYTTDRTDSGAVQFQDARTRADVTLQSSEIIGISRQQYEAGLKTISPALRRRIRRQ
jgi:hypothetical protein